MNWVGGRLQYSKRAGTGLTAQHRLNAAKFRHQQENKSRGGPAMPHFELADYFEELARRKVKTNSENALSSSPTRQRHAISQEATPLPVPEKASARMAKRPPIGHQPVKWKAKAPAYDLTTEEGIKAKRLELLHRSNWLQPPVHSTPRKMDFPSRKDIQNIGRRRKLTRDEAVFNQKRLEERSHKLLRHHGPLGRSHSAGHTSIRHDQISVRVGTNIHSSPKSQLRSVSNSQNYIGESSYVRPPVRHYFKESFGPENNDITRDDEINVSNARITTEQKLENDTSSLDDLETEQQQRDLNYGLHESNSSVLTLNRSVPFPADQHSHDTTGPSLDFMVHRKGPSILSPSPSGKLSPQPAQPGVTDGKRVGAAGLVSGDGSMRLVFRSSPSLPTLPEPHNLVLGEPTRLSTDSNWGQASESSWMGIPNSDEERWRSFAGIDEDGESVNFATVHHHDVGTHVDHIEMFSEQMADQAHDKLDVQPQELDAANTSSPVNQDSDECRWRSFTGIDKEHDANNVTNDYSSTDNPSPDPLITNCEPLANQDYKAVNDQSRAPTINMIDVGSDAKGKQSEQKGSHIEGTLSNENEVWYQFVHGFMEEGEEEEGEERFSTMAVAESSDKVSLVKTSDLQNTPPSDTATRLATTESTTEEALSKRAVAGDSDTRSISVLPAEYTFTSVQMQTTMPALSSSSPDVLAKMISSPSPAEKVFDLNTPQRIIFRPPVPFNNDSSSVMPMFYLGQKRGRRSLNPVGDQGLGRKRSLRRRLSGTKYEPLMSDEIDEIQD